MADPAYHRQAADLITGARSELQSIERDLASDYARWAALEDRG
jgi:hypothetical protein